MKLTFQTETEVTPDEFVDVLLTDSWNAELYDNKLRWIQREDGHPAKSFLANVDHHGRWINWS